MVLVHLGPEVAPITEEMMSLGGGMDRSSEKVELLGSLLRLVLQISARQWANREPSAGFSGLTKSRAS